MKNNAVQTIADMRTTFEKGVELPNGETFRLDEYIEKIDYNLYGTYRENGHDTVIGKKPYDNSVTIARTLLEQRSTDFSIGNTEISPKYPTRKARACSIVQKKAYERWMKNHAGAQLLDTITDTAPIYGAVLAKKTKDSVHVVRWQNVICDVTDPLAHPILEKIQMTPSELMGYTEWNNVEEVIAHNASRRMESEVGTETRPNDTIGYTVEILDLHGQIPLSVLKEAREEDVEEEDRHTFVLAHIVTSGDYILYAEEESEFPYKLYSRNPLMVPQRGIGQSIYDQLAETQKWHNFSRTEQMKMLAITGKILYYTNNQELAQEFKSVYKEGVDSGSIIGGAPGVEFSQVSQAPTALPQYQVIEDRLGAGADDITSSYASVTGAEQKAGTPFRAQALQNQMGMTQYTRLRNQIGEQFILPIIEDWIMPMAIKELKKETDLFDAFSKEELQFIDEAIQADAQNELFIQRSLEGKRVKQEESDAVQMTVEKELRKQGSKRMLKEIKDFLDTTQTQVNIYITDEQRNKSIIYESFANLLNSFTPEDPRREAVLDRVMDMIGVSSDELRMYEDKAMNDMQKQMPPQMPQRAPQQMQPQLQVTA